MPLPFVKSLPESGRSHHCGPFSGPLFARSTRRRDPDVENYPFGVRGFRGFMVEG